MKRKIIKIDETKCNGCGLCIPNCPEGALGIFDGKARIVSELSCDGLGACIGHCPQNAISIEEREAEKYNELVVIKNIVKSGPQTLKAHLHHLKSHNQTEYLKQALNYLKENNISIPIFENKTSCSCPGSKIIDRTQNTNTNTDNDKNYNIKSELRQWPVQLSLLNPNASYLKNADLLISADCVPFTYANFHQKFLKDKILIIFCPKLDSDIEMYIEKLTTILKENNINSITITRMEVPCCSETTKIVEEALKRSNKNILLKEYTISLQGEII
jgi:ferredoxin